MMGVIPAHCKGNENVDEWEEAEYLWSEIGSRGEDRVLFRAQAHMKSKEFAGPG